MIEEGTRWGYVLSAYGASAVVIGALVLWSWVFARRARDELARMEKRVGGRRRRAG